MKPETGEADGDGGGRFLAINNVGIEQGGTLRQRVLKGSSFSDFRFNTFVATGAIFKTTEYTRLQTPGRYLQIPVT